MSIIREEAFRAIDEGINQLKKDIQRQGSGNLLWRWFGGKKKHSEDTILALKARIHDFETLKKFIFTRNPSKNTGWVIELWFNANLLRQGKELVGTPYSKLVREAILPYLAFTFPSE
ncbi:hypothetical protein [Shimazuella kribbensis]|uniref:hypothetical protein n=1 Tax=Shimazuella kribbensis TaxID=139808 RepID=UPI0004183B61|nr:hypothetical protein [Shimazuella kribbensis]